MTFWIKNKIEDIALVLIVAVTLFLIVYSYFVASNYNVLDYDGALNAVMSKNLALKGKFCLDYETDIMFFKTISTGLSVLLPTSLIYKIFGITRFSTIVIPMIYYILLIVLIVSIFIKENKNFIFRLICITFISIVLLSNKTFYLVSHTLYGEIAAIFFAILPLFLFNVNDGKLNIKYILIGISLALSLSSKIIMIFYVVGFILIYLFDAVFIKNIKIMHVLMILIGFLFMMGLIYLFRLFQFEFDFRLTNNSICEYFQEMFSQSLVGYKDGNLYSKTCDRIQNLYHLIDIPFNCIFAIFFPSIFMLIIILKKGTNLNYNIIYSDVIASSAYIYYVFFGSDAYNYKRLIMYLIILYLYYIYLFTFALINSYASKQFFGILLSLFLVINLYSNVDYNSIVNNYIYFDINQKSYERQCQDEIIDFVNKNKNDSIFLRNITYNPDINLLTCVKQYEVFDFDAWIPLPKNKNIYFLTTNVTSMMDFDVLNFFKLLGYNVDEIIGKNRDYDNIYSFWKNDYLDLYAVYRIYKT